MKLQVKLHSRSEDEMSAAGKERTDNPADTNGSTMSFITSLSRLMSDDMSEGETYSSGYAQLGYGQNGFGSSVIEPDINIEVDEKSVDLGPNNDQNVKNLSNKLPLPPSYDEKNNYSSCFHKEQILHPPITSQFMDRYVPNNYPGEPHVKTETEEVDVEGFEPFRCDQCSRTFSKQVSLLHHKSRRCGKGRPYQCDVCLKCYLSNSHLKRHQETHTGEKPYRCEICDKCFGKQSHLSRHRIIHTNEKPYGCDICGKYFTRNEHLSRHRKTHTEEKPYGCHSCGKYFTRSEHLNRHQKIHIREMFGT